MFDTISLDETTAPASEAMTPDDVEQTLIDVELQIGRLRAQQLPLVRRADTMQLASADGSRSLHEWTAARLDISPEMAADWFEQPVRPAMLAATASALDTSRSVALPPLPASLHREHQCPYWRHRPTFLHPSWAPTRRS